MDWKNLVGQLNWATLDRRYDPRCHLACHGKTDGAGAQIQAYISTMLFARVFGFHYVHIPFETMELSPDGDAVGWARLWERTMSLGEGEFSHADLPQMPMRAHRTCRFIRKRRGVLQVPRHCLHWLDRHVDLHSLIMPDLRARYLKNVPAPFAPRTSGPLRIALHVKRNDPGNQTRLTSNEIVARMMRSVETVLRSMDVAYRFEICSLGTEADFEELKPFDPLFRLNEPAVDAFHALTGADMMLTAKSSFSYVAALYNRGVKLYEPFWHPPMSDWVVMRDGETDPAAMRRAIETHLAKRAG